MTRVDFFFCISCACLMTIPWYVFVMQCCSALKDKFGILMNTFQLFGAPSAQ